ncbi:MAG: hypothetical protein IJG87_02250 [Ruminococcus sp.]|nr:hypothetical protein [Ruminococcus sp.]
MDDNKKYYNVFVGEKWELDALHELATGSAGGGGSSLPSVTSALYIVVDAQAGDSVDPDWGTIRVSGMSYTDTKAKIVAKEPFGIDLCVFKDWGDGWYDMTTGVARVEISWANVGSTEAITIMVDSFFEGYWLPNGTITTESPFNGGGGAGGGGEPEETGA